MLPRVTKEAVAVAAVDCLTALAIDLDDREVFAKENPEILPLYDASPSQEFQDGFLVCYILLRAQDKLDNA